jgi:hypothetical protein
VFHLLLIILPEAVRRSEIVVLLPGKIPLLGILLPEQRPLLEELQWRGQVVTVAVIGNDCNR